MLTEERMLATAWPSPQRAAMFLAFVGLLSFPAKCPQGHTWPWAVGLHCRKRGQDEDEEDSDGMPQRKRGRLCNKKMSWTGPRFPRGVEPDLTRVPCPLAQGFARSLAPEGLIKALYWFSMRVSFAQAVASSGLHEKVLRRVFLRIREALQSRLHGAEWPKLGGPPDTYAVCIDETFFTKRRRVAGGDFGRVRAPHKTIVMAGVELNHITRQDIPPPGVVPKFPGRVVDTRGSFVRPFSPLFRARLAENGFTGRVRQATELAQTHSTSP